MIYCGFLICELTALLRVASMRQKSDLILYLQTGSLYEASIEGV